MEKFTNITSKAYPLMIANIDTDMIIPKQFLKTVKRTGLGEGLFFEMRFDENGAKTDSVLNSTDFSGSQIVVAGDNFGCGSSREHAPWALLDFGIKCVIAPSFADIFYNNCFKNGILPIAMPEEKLKEILDTAEKQLDITIDLQNQQVIAQNKTYKFEIDDFRKVCLLEGLDDIGLTLQQSESIAKFEELQKLSNPWLY